MSATRLPAYGSRSAIGAVPYGTYQGVNYLGLRWRAADPADVERLAILIPRARSAHVVSKGSMTIPAEDVMRRICLCFVFHSRRTVPIAAVFAVDACSPREVEADVCSRVGVICPREPGICGETDARTCPRIALVPALARPSAIPNVILTQMLRLLERPLLLHLRTKAGEENVRSTRCPTHVGRRLLVLTPLISGCNTADP
eukprot:scaffold216035_cov32-Tisochrysis_lutea.AAC.1